MREGSDVCGKLYKNITMPCDSCGTDPKPGPAPAMVLVTSDLWGTDQGDTGQGGPG